MKKKYEKEYPIYNKKELRNAEEEGWYDISEFAYFTKELRKRELWENKKEKGVLAQVEGKGTKELSERQSNLLNVITLRYKNKVCKFGCPDISLLEALDFEENGGMCLTHKERMEKDD